MIDINRILDENPALIARCAEEAEEQRYIWQVDKETYEHKEAAYVLKLKAEKENLKTTEIKYYIANDEDLYNDRLTLLLQESNYRKKEVEIKALEESLNASKMMARMKVAELSARLDWGITKKEDI